MKLIIAACLFFSASLTFAQNQTCDFYSRQCPSKFEKYTTATAFINEQIRNREITEQQGTLRILDLTRNMYPKDAMLISIANQLHVTAKILPSANMPQTQKDELEKATHKVFTEVLAERLAMFDMAKELNQKMAAPQANTAAQVVYVEPAPLSDVAIPNAVFLNKVGQAFSTSYGQYLQPMPMCSYGKGSVMCY